MNIFSAFSRIIVGTLFIISGLIKANDTIGFSYKLEEYFAPDVLGWTFLEPYALSLAVFVCIAEILLGLATLLGARIKLVTWLLLILNSFFTLLTFYSAYFNKVTDCGCFGDAIPLTPWQSFYKDIVLMVFIIVIFIYRNKIKINNSSQNLSYFTIATTLISLFGLMILNWAFPLVFALVLFGGSLAIILLLNSNFKDWIVAFFALILIGGFISYTQNHLPIKDFRAYAVGKNIAQGMIIPNGAPLPVYKNTFIYLNKNTKKEETFTEENYPWNDANYEFIDRKSELVQKGYEPKVKDFVFYTYEGDEVSHYFSDNEEFVFLIVAYNLDQTSEQGFKKINQLAFNAFQDGVYSYGATASSWDNIASFSEANKVPFDFVVADETMLKTIVRSSPGLLLIKEGNILGKWHHNDIPQYIDIKEQLMQ